MIERLKKNHLWAYTLVLPVYLICFYTVEYFVTENYHVMYMPLDDKIPFCEWFSLPYILWMPMLIAAALYLLYNDTALQLLKIQICLLILCSIFTHAIPTPMCVPACMLSVLSRQFSGSFTQKSCVHGRLK